MSAISANKRFQEILERKQAELMGGLRNRDGITIEKVRIKWTFSMRRSSLAIRNVNHGSS